MKRDKATAQTIVDGKIAAFRRDAHRFFELHQTVAGRATVPLYKLEGKLPQQFASAVVFAAGERVFLLTAAHVVDDFRENPILICPDDKFRLLSGFVHRSDPLESPLGKDFLDYALVRVDGDEANLLRPVATTWRDAYVIPKDIALHRGLVIVGCASKKTKLRGTRLESTMDAVEVPGAFANTYTQWGVNPSEVLLMRYAKQFYTVRGVKRPHSLAGMSGSGVWFVPSLSPGPFPAERPFVSPKLLGIFSNHFRQESIFSAATVKHLFKLVSRYYPELNQQLNEERHAHQRGEMMKPWLQQ